VIEVRACQLILDTGIYIGIVIHLYNKGAGKGTGRHSVCLKTAIFQGDQRVYIACLPIAEGDVHTVRPGRTPPYKMLICAICLYGGVVK